jgi:hypothetical protein
MKLTPTLIQNKIYEIRGHKVMLDFDLAEMYEVETKVFNQSVKRNANRFPPDFTFTLTQQEFQRLRSQIVTSNKRGDTRYLPNAFTEQSVSLPKSLRRRDLWRKGYIGKHCHYSHFCIGKTICIGL